MPETPTITATSYAHALNASSLGGLTPDAISKLANYAGIGAITHGQQHITQPTKESAMPDFSTRLVKVFIVDPNVNLPLESRLLYNGEEKITDLTDQELFFEIDINGLLTKHNETRIKTEDKKANKDKPVYLEAARVRDLKMQVVVLAQF